MHDNFWAMGDTGPCGPCSEVHYFQGDHLPCAEVDGGAPVPGRGLRVRPLDRDLEPRLHAVQPRRGRQHGAPARPLRGHGHGPGAPRRRHAGQALQLRHGPHPAPTSRRPRASAARAYGESKPSDVCLRVIADHVRAATFLVADGVIPSNEGRGYVLRKIVRRALRHGKKLGLEKPFLHGMVGVVCDADGRGATPRSWRTGRPWRRSSSWRRSPSRPPSPWASSSLLEVTAALTPPNDREIPGDALFKLYDTFGFPMDLAEDIAKEQGLALDMAGFEACMEKQRELARPVLEGRGGHPGPTGASRRRAITTHFVGYTTPARRGRALPAHPQGRRARPQGRPRATRWSSSSTGRPSTARAAARWATGGPSRRRTASFRVVDTQKPVPWLFFHRGEVATGEIREGDVATLEVDAEARAATMAHHTATHLLHAALREILGNAREAGGLPRGAHAPALRLPPFRRGGARPPRRHRGVGQRAPS